MGGEYFDGYFSRQYRVLREIDGPHAATTDLTNELELSNLCDIYAKEVLILNRRGQIEIGFSAFMVFEKLFEICLNFGAEIEALDIAPPLAWRKACCFIENGSELL